MLTEIEAFWICMVTAHRVRKDAEETKMPITLTAQGADRVRTACTNRLHELEPKRWQVIVDRHVSERTFTIAVQEVQ
jgi:hypothetical protein